MAVDRLIGWAAEKAGELALFAISASFALGIWVQNIVNDIEALKQQKADVTVTVQTAKDIEYIKESLIEIKGDVRELREQKEDKGAKP